VLHARGWLEPFFGWHNDDHQHSGLALFTPAEVFFRRVPAVHAVRQKALDAAYALHPGRFPNGPPKAALPPAQVHINPLEARAISVDTEVPIPMSINFPPIDDSALPNGSQKALHATARTPRREALAAAAAAFPS
jgi:hypothetical protein